LQWEPISGIPTVVSTSRLDTEQFFRYCEAIRTWAAVDLGVYIPDPNEVVHEDSNHLNTLTDGE
jgi:hypothetical protein